MGNVLLLPDPIDASSAGVISIGDNLRIFNLGNGTMVVATSHELAEQLSELELLGGFKDALAAEHVLFVHSNNGDLGSYVALRDSQDFRAAVREIVESIRLEHFDV